MTLHPPASPTELTLVATAILVNLLLAAMFTAQARGRERIEALLHQLVLLAALPLAAVVYLNATAGEPWWAVVLPLPLAAHFGLEFLLEHVLGTELDPASIGGGYVLLYYAGLVGVTVYAFLIAAEYGFAVVAAYVINLWGTNKAAGAAHPE